MNGSLEKEKTEPYKILDGDILKIVSKDSLDPEGYCKNGFHIYVRRIHEEDSVEVTILESMVHFALQKEEIEALVNNGSLEITEGIDVDLYNAKDDL